MSDENNDVNGSDDINVTKLDEDTLTAIGDKVLESILPELHAAIGRFQDKGSDAGDDKPDAGSGGTQFSIEELTEAITAKLTEQSAGNNQEVFNTLFSDKLETAVRETPGLNDFLEGEDDYGRVRKDELLKIEDFDKRVEALGKIQKSYNEAVSGTNANRRPVVDVKAEKRVKEAEGKYLEITDKYRKGEFSTPAEFASAFMAALSEEVAPLL